MLIDRPWTRVRNPVAIPTQYTATDLREKPDIDFAELVRSQLVPREQTRGGKRTWEKLWETIRQDEALTDRTYDILEQFLDTTEAALEGDDLEPEQRKRATKFAELCRHGWQRIDREPPALPLAWAGKAGDYQPSARRVIATLVSAISRHRAITEPAGPRPADRELWEALRRVHLDPADYGQLEPPRQSE